MSTSTKEENRTGVERIPAGMHTVTPHLICAGAAQAIEFYQRAFGAVELSRLPGVDGKIMHASIRIGDSVIMLNDELPQWGAFGPKSLKGSPVTILSMSRTRTPSSRERYRRARRRRCRWKMPSGAIATGKWKTRLAINGRSRLTSAT